MCKPAPSPPPVLVFAASDPSCGAGIQADLLTLAALGCHPLTVLTALTVQDTAGVTSGHPVAASLVEAQARALLSDMPVAAVKVGVLGSAENARMVAKIVAEFPQTPLVLDPVLASGRGDAFVDADLLAVLREKLLPRATLITPNLPEAFRLLGEAVPDDAALAHADLAALTADLAARLLALGPRYVLITGAHAPTPSVVNRLYGATGVIYENRWQRLPESYHGSGCTLASAIAAHLAHEGKMDAAVDLAENYAWHTLAHGYRPGQGQWIPNRLYEIHPCRLFLRQCGLYAILPDGLDTPTLIAVAEAVLQGGGRWLQYRAKTVDAKTRQTQAIALRRLRDFHDACLIINDDIKLARTVRANGVHLGRDDISVAEARHILGEDVFIGASCYDDFERAKAMVTEGADYVAFGAVYDSPTKPQAPRAPLDLFARAKAELAVPVCAIGGITLENAPPLIKAGADFLAIISDLFQSLSDPDMDFNTQLAAITERTRAYQLLFKGQIPS
ncbi:MAG: thiamine phosphate synthase [Zoogloeaceae bacterium]|jgi:hydroxymethylpyrimidine/phosphomethylpyrimidine kinase|nr:thiamine phosphate synthase [Zoogloeaceae bacterium]